MTKYILFSTNKHIERQIAGTAVSLQQALCVIFMILDSLENVKKLFWMVARLPQRLKSTFFELFSHYAGPFGPLG